MPWGRQPANMSWFNFNISSNSQALSDLGVYAFSGKEAINTPYEFAVEVVSKSKNLPILEALGKECCLAITDKSGDKRLVHGLIRQMEQLHTAHEHTHYLCHMVPRIWFLALTQDQRIYQRQNVREIINTVLRKHNFTANAYSFKLKESYKEREYCVQFGESDLHFITRLCEEEGLFYYHEHKENGHCLCFSDFEGGPAIAGENPLRFHPGSGHAADTAVISRLNLKQRINSDAATYREWNFTTPAVDLTGHKQEIEWEKAPTPQAMNLETYQFPHLYQVRNEGERYTNIQLLRQLTFNQWIEGESDVSRYLPGFTFSIYEHPRDEVNRSWWVVEAQHEGNQPAVLEHEAPDGRGLEYKSTIKAIPDNIRFVPEAKHKKVRIEGLQSAIVTGPQGEEVYVDKYGRVKVQFHWDRFGTHDESTTCWVRVADSWAGANFGFIQLPRIGQEVMVEFMEGDPDRPVVTGRVYNEELMPPWQLPGQKTLSGIQSREFKGAQRNQLVLDDTPGEVQAQLSSDHGLSQLNLGYLTRVNHIEGRQDFRGEGFELRTDGWGAMRAAKGLFISTDIRSSAQAHHKDMSELLENLQRAEKQHVGRFDLAVKHNAHETEEQDYVSQVLKTQNKQVRGAGQPHKELENPHIVLSSPAGIATSTPESMHMYTGNSFALTADQQLSITSGKSILGVAMEKIRLFAYKMGIKLFAAKGKIEIQAQSDAMDIIADKVLRLISAKERIEIAAAKEIYLVADGTSLRINKSGILHHSPGKFEVYASAQNYNGPQSDSYTLPKFPTAEPKTCKLAAAKNKAIFY